MLIQCFNSAVCNCMFNCSFPPWDKTGFFTRLIEALLSHSKVYFQFSKIFTIYRHIGDIHPMIYRLSKLSISSIFVESLLNHWSSLRKDQWFPGVCLEVTYIWHAHRIWSANNSCHCHVVNATGCSSMPPFCYIWSTLHCAMKTAIDNQRCDHAR